MGVASSIEAEKPTNGHILKKEWSSPSNSQSLVMPQQKMGLGDHLSSTWDVGWFVFCSSCPRNQSCCEFQRTPQQSSLPLSSFFPSSVVFPLPCATNIDDWIMAENSLCGLHLNWFCVSPLTSVYYKKNLPWPRPRTALMSVAININVKKAI